MKNPGRNNALHPVAAAIHPPQSLYNYFRPTAQEARAEGKITIPSYWLIDFLKTVAVQNNWEPRQEGVERFFPTDPRTTITKYDNGANLTEDEKTTVDLYTNFLAAQIVRGPSLRHKDAHQVILCDQYGNLTEEAIDYHTNTEITGIENNIGYRPSGAEDGWQILLFNELTWPAFSVLHDACYGDPTRLVENAQYGTLKPQVLNELLIFGLGYWKFHRLPKMKGRGIKTFVPNFWGRRLAEILEHSRTTIWTQEAGEIPEVARQAARLRNNYKYAKPNARELISVQAQIDIFEQANRDAPVELYQRRRELQGD